MECGVGGKRDGTRGHTAASARGRGPPESRPCGAGHPVLVPYGTSAIGNVVGSKFLDSWQLYLRGMAEVGHEVTDVVGGEGIEEAVGHR